MPPFIPDKTGWQPIDFKNIPAYNRQHLEQRIRERLTWPHAVRPLIEWMQTKPLAPDGPWFKAFPGFYLVGRGTTPVTVRTREMGAKGMRISHTALNTRLYTRLPDNLGPKSAGSYIWPVLASMDTRTAEEKPKFKYGTVQAELPEDSEAHHAIADMQAEIDPADLMGHGIDLGAIHITVRYGIQSDDTANIERFLSEQAPIRATLQATSSFEPTKHSDYATPIIAPVACPELFELNERLADIGDFKPADFDYKPHCTVGYVRPEVAEDYIGLTATEGQKFTIREIAVVNQSGDKKVIMLNGTPKQAGVNLPVRLFAVAPSSERKHIHKSGLRASSIRGKWPVVTAVGDCNELLPGGAHYTKGLLSDHDIWKIRTEPGQWERTEAGTYISVEDVSASLLSLHYAVPGPAIAA